MRFLSRKLRVLAFGIVLSSGCLGPIATEIEMGPNLLANPSLETGDAMPSGWEQGAWGANNVVYTYPASPAADGERAASVEITSYTNGDAKWYPTSVAVRPNTMYRFVDSYSSTIPSVVTVQFFLTDGTSSYLDLASPEASSSFAKVDVVFVTPANVASATVFHLIRGVGRLTIDSCELREVIDPNPTGNLVANSSFEWINGNLPYGWRQGGWGTNAASFTYPVAGLSGQKAARVEITSYTNGDAKWFFNEVPVTPGVMYTYSNLSVSNIDSYVAIQYRMADGTLSHQMLGLVPPSSKQREFACSFVAPPNAASATIYQLIKAVGSLTIDDVSLTTSPEGFARFEYGFVSLDFDDGERQTMQNVLPSLSALGIPTTQYIMSNSLDDSRYDSASDVLALQGAGHLIGSHTRTHPDLTTLSNTLMRQEVSGSREDLLAIGASPVSYLAFPYGAFNSEVLEAVRDSEYTASRTTIGGLNVQNDDPYQLRSFGVQRGVTFEQVRAQIDLAVSTKQWLIMVFHRVGQGDDQYTITQELFEQIVSYIDAQNVPVMTAEEGVSLMEP